MDPSATEADIQAYIRDARLQVQMKKDAEVLNDFETCIQLANDSKEIEERIYRATMRSLESLTSGDSPLQRAVDLESDYIRRGVPVPRDLLRLLDKELADQKADDERDRKSTEIEHNYAKVESDKAQTLYKKIRSDLNMPALPE
jgi:hypothetical protein